MSIPYTWRAQQTSSTAGTGTLTLNAAAANRIGFAASVGGSQSVFYSLSVAGTNLWEIGTGVFNGASPGTLTRVTVMASSNAGSLVSFTGTIDVILAMVPGQRMRATFTGSATETIADLGNILTFTGSAAATRTLPALATVPVGAGYLYVNAGTSGAVLTLDPNGSETINGASTLSVLTGESVEIFATATGWFATGLPSVALVRRQTASASSVIDFTLPSGFSRFNVDFTEVTAATDGAILSLRTSVDGGSSFSAGGTDYNNTTQASRPGTNSVTSSNLNATAIILSPPIDTASAAITAHGDVRINIGGASRQASAYVNGSSLDNDTALLSVFSGAGHRTASGAINAIRFLMSTGNISAGTFSLYAVR